MGFRLLFFCVVLTIISSCIEKTETLQIEPLNISENGRYFMTNSGEPFFWLGDTGWLLLSKPNREEAVMYLEDRKEKGFNVIQAMVLHNVFTCNIYGDSALVAGDVSLPLTKAGNNPDNPDQYDYWDHVDYIMQKAGELGLYMALVPVWGSNVKAGKVSREQAAEYANWLGTRYGNLPHIIWLNGGDLRGSDSTGVWQTFGRTLSQSTSGQLITYHPFGRTQSSDWFHNEPWLDFNMFQSGHRRYDQDDTERGYGEDNWKYVAADYQMFPVKPTLDGEPSYEGIPQGLHDTLQPRWNDNDLRRYAYWSVFAGAAGFTYGHNEIMQFYRPGDKDRAYGATKSWKEALNDPGAQQMIHLKNLMLSRPYFDRIPDQSLLAGENGARYDYQVATRGNEFAFIYTYNGKMITVNTGKIAGDSLKATWYNPRNGEKIGIGQYENSGILEFDPPGDPEEGNDWVLILDSN